MDSTLANSILEQGEKLGVHSFKTNYRGESTLNPAFEIITRRAKQLASGSTYIDRITNSNFNFKNENDSIFSGLGNQTKVKVSFDSFIKDVYLKQRNGSNYDRVLKNIDKFYNLPGRSNILVIQSVRTLANKDEDLEGEIKKRWPEALISIRDVVEGRVNKDLSNTVIKKRDKNNRQACRQAFARLMINWDGTVQMCCPDIKSKLIIGDANFDFIKDIWQSKKAIDIRQSLKNKTAFKKDPCLKCSSFESFGGYKAPFNS
jgi:radical SAM protein with 4Fe4S-binding SPASM domain